MSQQATLVALPPGEDTLVCRHHWQIQPATGPVSAGVCLRCGKMGEFKNYIEASPWGEEHLGLQAYGDSPVGMAGAIADYLGNGDAESEP